jgi:hypothetical protein
MTSPFIDSLLRMAETYSLGNDLARKVLCEGIQQSVAGMTDDPRQSSAGNTQLLHHICVLNLMKAEELYGDSELDKVYLFPFFQGLPRSMVRALIAPKDKFGLVVAQWADTWEQVFYEIAHESIHLLNPVIPDGRRMATLDEGVAVRFAEENYIDWITPYSKRPPVISPVTQPDLFYCPAFLATKPIPNTALRAVREEFGSFWAVDDMQRFVSLTGAYVSDDQAELLTGPFHGSI